MGRAPCCDKANVKKGPWCPEEDAKLKAYIDKYGTGGNWIALPQKIGLKRCGKSCRLRWLNYLRPNIKHGGFTEEEDNIICSLYISIGSRWSIIAAQLPGRTDNDIKNYWNTRLKKKLLGRRKNSSSNNRFSNNIPGHNQIIDNATEEENNSYNNLSSSALERLQLHMHLQNNNNNDNNNPLSFHNNPVLWPKLNPLHHKMIQTLHSLNPNPTDQIHSSTITNPDQLLPAPVSSDLDHQDYYSPLSNLIVSNNTDDDQINGLDLSGFTETELEDLLNNKSSGTSLAAENNITGGLKDNLGWWSDEFDASSASLNSWDSAVTMFHDQPQEIVYDQDYVLGYSMH
ncbi:hypothetical protein ACP275_10G143200 [Erythranthe tilingii]